MQKKLKPNMKPYKLVSLYVLHNCKVVEHGDSCHLLQGFDKKIVFCWYVAKNVVWMNKPCNYLCVAKLKYVESFIVKLFNCCFILANNLQVM